MRSVWASNMNLNLKIKYLLLIKRNINCQLQEQNIFFAYNSDKCSQ